jgi:two-component system, NarL family, response regulator NreC
LTVHILIADDHGVLRGGLRVLLNEQPDWQVVGEASDGTQALRLTEELHPDLLLLDISMPGVDGIEVTRLLKQRMPQLQILILTVHEDQEMLREAVRAGASGYVIKRAAQSELISAINAVLRGDLYVHPAMTRGLLGSAVTPGPAPAAVDDANLDLLTRREMQVLSLIAQGYTNQQIAEDLVVSVRTVESHRANIMTKLGLHNRAELVQYAMTHGFLKES